MRVRWVVPLLLVVGGVLGARPVRAQEVVQSSLAQRPLLMTLGGGVCVPRSGRFVGGAANEFPLPYLEANLQLDFWRPSVGTSIGASAFAAAAFCLGGGMFGGTVRVAQPWDERSMRLSAGLGPSVGSDGVLLAEADVSLEVRSKVGFAMVLGPKIAVALNHATSGTCGVDTCGVDVPPGSLLLLFRLGLGFNL